MVPLTEIHACIQWINSFQGNSFVVKQSQDLTDGVILFEILIDIDYNWFKVENGPETPIGDHWIVKKLNLQKLYQLLESYYSEQGLHFQRFPSVSIGDIAEYNQEHETLKLCKLILFVAHHVQPQSLLALPEETQTVLKSIINTYQTYEDQEEEEEEEEEVAQNEEGTAEELNLQIHQLKELLTQKDNQLDAKDEEIADLNTKYSIIEEQKQHLFIENTQLHDEITELNRQLNEAMTPSNDHMMIDDSNESNNNVIKLEEEIRQLEQSNKLKEDDLAAFHDKYNALLTERNSLDNALKEARSNDQFTINQLQKELNDLKLKPASSQTEPAESYQKLLLEKEYLENQNIEQKDLLIDREKAVYELRSLLLSLETMDEDSAKRQVIELEHERSLAADAMYMMSKKIEKSKAFIIEQNNIIKSLEPKETYSEAIKALQTELKTREQEIMQLKKRAHEGALQARREQRLMMSAWYNVTQKHSVDLVKANK